jgi:hypothetical protein
MFHDHSPSNYEESLDTLSVLPFVSSSSADLQTSLTFATAELKPCWDRLAECKV